MKNDLLQKMNMMHRDKVKKKLTGRGLWLLPAAFLVVHLSFFISCARMGSPDGGWYDDTPPRVISSSPLEGDVNVTTKKIVINFDEFIKVENAQEKVIVSPPQLEQAEIKPSGKRIIIELKDTLKENTTYTVDFSDAITDNNEGNPLGNYTFSFSTGGHIDTLEVSGYVLNAEDLEPVKGALVGLYPYDAPDSIFRHEPMIRVSRTNANGQFTVKGIAPGSYRAFALNDADGDFVFGQKSEKIAFSHDKIEPSWKPDTRQDTIWSDSLHIANILQKPYTHFLPDDITLLFFQEEQTDRFLIKNDRLQPEKLELYFTYGHDSLPQIKGLNFPTDSTLVVEHSEKRDTVFYWLRDTVLINQDTLTMEVRYMGTDTLGMLAQQVDTLTFLPKVSYEKRMKDAEKELEKWQKEQEKKKKQGEHYDSVMPMKYLVPRLTPSNQVVPGQQVLLETSEPMARCDFAAIHLYKKVDSLWYDERVEIEQLSPRKIEMAMDWKANTEYSLEIDSGAIENIYGLTNNIIKQGLKVGNPDELSTLMLEISGMPVTATDSAAALIVQILDSSGKLVYQKKASKGKVEFDYVNPSTYYLSAYYDMNGNGKWDTGNYDEDLQPEPVYYFNEEVECKAKWDVSRKWNLTATPRFKQKPEKIIKQKPEKAKKLKNRNLERAKKLGKEYIQDKTGMRM